LTGLPRKYREPIVLCDLEGRSRREAARLLGLPEGTLASRLATARRLLARRLSRYGLSLSGGALATVVAAESAAAAVPPVLVLATARAATQVAAGQLAAVSTPVALLMKGVLKAMFVQKLKVVAAVVLVAVACGVGSLAYQAAEPSRSGPAPARESRPPSDLEALRKENELLRLNLLVLLEKIHAQEAELASLKGKKGAAAPRAWERPGQDTIADPFGKPRFPDDNLPAHRPKDPQPNKIKTPQGDSPFGIQPKSPDPVLDVEAALKLLREARDAESNRRAAEALQKAANKLLGQADHNYPK
jgi:hypothetical protein